MVEIDKKERTTRLTAITADSIIAYVRTSQKISIFAVTNGYTKPLPAIG